MFYEFKKQTDGPYITKEPILWLILVAYTCGSIQSCLRRRLALHALLQTALLDKSPCNTL